MSLNRPQLKHMSYQARFRVRVRLREDEAVSFLDDLGVAKC